jgi:hypothetical protein
MLIGYVNVLKFVQRHRYIFDILKVSEAGSVSVIRLKGQLYSVRPNREDSLDYWTRSCRDAGYRQRKGDALTSILLPRTRCPSVCFGQSFKFARIGPVVWKRKGPAKGLIVRKAVPQYMKLQK